MSMGRLVLRTVGVAIAMFALGFIGHLLLLGRDCAVIEPIMRDKADMQLHMPFAFICFSGAFVGIYSKSRSERFWLGQGVRFGIAIWAVGSVPLYLTSYTIEPWPAVVVAKILAWELAAMAAWGGLTAALAKGDCRIYGGTF